jgi:hypothetical protein
MIYYFRKVAVLLLTFWLFALRTGQAMGTATYLELQPRPGNFCIAQGGGPPEFLLAQMISPASFARPGICKRMLEK